MKKRESQFLINILLLVVSLQFNLSLLSQSPNDTVIDSDFNDYYKQQLNSSSDKEKAELKKTFLLRLKLEQSEIKTKIAREKYFTLQFESYQTKSLNHRWESYQWQLTTGKLIFWLVILIVVSGLTFSGIQFYLSLIGFKSNNSVKKSLNGQTDEGKAESATEVEFSLTGFRIKSSILGLLVLTISIAFFFLYLVHVYPIKENKGIETNSSNGYHTNLTE